jgi:hypothetical protein
MLVGHQDFGRLVDAIGRKLAADPKKYRKIAQETEPYFGCAGDYSSEAPCLGEVDAYGRALNRMHYAVNASRMNPEASGGPSSTGESVPGRECEPHWYFQANCSSVSNYDLCTCSPGSSPGFNCVDGTTFSPCTPCIAPDIHGCELYKCTGGYSCSPSFRCSSVYYQKNADCPTRLPFNCSRFDCSSQGSDFGCEDGDHTCGQAGGFNCQPPGSFFNCRGEYVCKPVIAPFACQALRYNCAGENQCASYVGFSCASIHDCKDDVWCTSVVFSCDDTTGSFRCSGGPIFCSEGFCTSVIKCENQNPGVPVFECAPEFSCQAQFNP